MVSAAGKKIPVLVSPVVVIAGDDTVPAENVATPVAPSVVKLPAAAVEPPIAMPLMLPPVSVAPDDASVFSVAVEDAPRVVKLPAAADAPPIVVPSIVPPLMSVVVKTEEASVTTPVELAIEPAAVPSLALRLVTSRLVVSTVVAFTVPKAG